MADTVLSWESCMQGSLRRQPRNVDLAAEQVCHRQRRKDHRRFRSRRKRRWPKVPFRVEAIPCLEAVGALSSRTGFRRGQACFEVGLAGGLEFQKAWQGQDLRRRKTLT